MSQPVASSSTEPQLQILILGANNYRVDQYREVLGQVTHFVTVVTSMDDALSIIGGGEVSFVVIDSGIPPLCPVEASRYIRSRNALPILFLLNEDLEESKIAELYSVPDMDVLRGPVSALALQSRARMLTNLIDKENEVRRLRTMNADLEQFARRACHDLIQPLRTVFSYVHLIQRNHSLHLDSEAKRFIEYAADGTRRMKKMVEDILVFQRNPSELPQIEKIDVNSVIRDVLQDLQSMLQETNAVVSLGALPVLSGYRSQLYQLFQNLILNAIKFRNYRPPFIHIEATATNTGWLISVKDDGMGFDQNDSERIFSLFERVRHEPDSPGRGIGLAICKRIMERHGGRIWTESEIGKGSTFYLSFPLGDDSGNQI